MTIVSMTLPMTTTTTMMMVMMIMMMMELVLNIGFFEGNSYCAECKAPCTTTPPSASNL